MMAFASCSSIDCMLNGTVLCHIAIQDEEGNADTLSYPLSVTLHRVTESGDTVYINQQSSVTTLDIPLSYNAETDVITLTLHTGEETTVSDNISITKTNEPYFESVDCSPRFHHTLQSVSHTSNFIDNILINEPKVNNDASNTNIYIRINSNN